MLTVIRISGERFRVVTPVACTTSGRFAWARLTRFCTSTWARFRSVPISKVTVSVYEPSEVHCDVM